ncbi:MAG: hypothetical protein ABSC89_02485 [Verrucomicrobiota bacterium]
MFIILPFFFLGGPRCDNHRFSKPLNRFGSPRGGAVQRSSYDRFARSTARAAFFVKDHTKFLPVANGMLRLSDRILLPFSPAYRCRHKLAVAYDAGAYAENFMASLRSSLPRKIPLLRATAAARRTRFGSFLARFP